ncbi:Iron-sulfur cluster assembly protein IscA [Candidatus Hepatincolaceae symbiont of Richtersius coronifer]
MTPQLVNLTQSAIEKIYSLLATKTEQPLGLRISLRTKGCSGLSWNLDFVYEANKFDEIIEVKGIKVFIDPKAVLFILGSKIDYVKTELEEGFEFSNPNEKSKCGCGESFKV